MSTLTVRSLENYVYSRFLGGGSYGSVACYKSCNDDKYIAIKKILVETDLGVSQIALRELNGFSNLRNHPYLLNIEGVHLAIIGKNTLVQIITESCTSDLRQFISKVPIDQRLGSNAETLCLIYHQILSAIEAMDYHSIMHRDIKPSNIMVNYDFDTRTGILSPYPIIKLGDMSFGRHISRIRGRRQRSYTKEVYTSCYRAPEVEASIIGFADSYGVSAEIWSVGCVMYEYICRRSLEIFGIHKTVFDMISETIPEFSIPPVDPKLNLTKRKFLKIPARRLISNFLADDLYAIIPDSVFELLERCLEISPGRRISVKQALNLPIFVNMPQLDPPYHEDIFGDYEENYRVCTGESYNIYGMKLRDTAIKYGRTIETYVCALYITAKVLGILSPNTLDKCKLTELIYASIWISSKLNDAYPLDLGEFQLTKAQEKSMIELEKVILDAMDYVLYTKDVLATVDIVMLYVNKVDNITEKYGLLYDTFGDACLSYRALVLATESRM